MNMRVYPITERIVLCSYPKTGRTWVRWFYVQYANALYGVGWERTFDLLLLNIISPPFWLTRAGKRGQPWPCTPLLPSHEDIDIHPKIALIRHPGDTLVSYYHHLREEGDLDAFVLERLPEYVTFYGHMHADLWLEYENMDFRALLDFCGVPFDEGAYRTALGLSSFDHMKADERKGEEPSCGWRVRKGKVGNYKDVLRPETVTQVETAGRSVYRVLRGAM